MFVSAFTTFLIIVSATGHDTMTRDVGDIFVMTRDVAKYTAERLEAAREGRPLPDPPRLYADVVSLRIELISTSLYQISAFLIAAGVAVFTTPGGVREVIRRVGLDRNPLPHAWRPALVVVGAYGFVIGYAVIMRAIGPGFLVPQSTVPSSVTSDTSTLALAGLAALLLAPVAEECFFRGMIFTGLLRWRFWPAASISALLFTGAHFDLGSLLPFFCVGLAMAWLYWSRGSLWDSMIFHFLFNFTSFLLLVAGA